MFIPSIIGLSDEANFEKQAIAAQEFLFLHKRYWPAILLTVVIFGIHSLYVLHRILGPLYRFREAFERISEGDLSFDVELRKTDYLMVYRDSLDAMIRSLRDTIGPLARDRADALEEIGKLDQELSSENMSFEDVRRRLREIRKKEEELKSRLAHFKVGNPENR
jgi:methyl-accepting chemotaxis protein